MAQNGGGFASRAQSFLVLAKLNFSDGHVTEYLLISRVLDTAIVWDQVHALNLACLEMLCRRFQLIEEKYRHRLPQLDPKNTLDPDADVGLFLGLGAASSFGKQSVCVMPELSEYIGEELAKEAAITKGKVKAYELREQVKKLAKGGRKGDGKQEGE